MWIRRLLAPPVERPSLEDEARAYGALLLAEAREEVHHADNKAQVLLGIVGVGLGAITGGLLAGAWSPRDLADAIEWLWWIGTAAAVAAVIVLAAAVYPRLDKTSRDRRIGNPKWDRGDTVLYFADVLRFPSEQAVTDALLRSSPHHLERVAHQLNRIGHIASSKYRLIRWGCWLMLAALASTVGSVLINLAL